MPYMFVYTTAKDESEATTIAQHVVNQRVAACANILPGMKSFYHWQGKVQADSEVIIIFKTTTEQFDALEEAILEKHSYECPCIIGLPIKGGHLPYLNWIDSNVN